MQTISDKECDKIFQHMYDQQFSIKCKNGNLIFELCIQQKCNKPSLRCKKEDCNECFGAHPFCRMTTLEPFIQFIKDSNERQMQLYSSTLQIQKEIIKAIKKSQQKMMKNFTFSGLPKSIKTPLQYMFINKKLDYLTGMDIYALKQDILKLKPVSKAKQILQHTMTVEQCIINYLKEKEQIILTCEGNQQINSKILTKEQDIHFIFKSLNHPKKLQLLYRGTQNNFSAAKFHEMCDNIEHTITIVRSQFDKIIGGYTPLRWSCPPNWVYFSDQSKQSFLLQVNLKQKMNLVDHLYSIYCHQSYGPRFGRADLTIPNKCNQTHCTGNFPTSYNLANKYQASQQSHHAFSGCLKGFEFRAIQYEVFKVIFDYQL